MISGTVLGRVALAGLSLGAVTAGGLNLLSAREVTAPRTAALALPVERAATVAWPEVDSLLASVVDEAPFRAGRRPARARYQPDGGAAPPAPAAPAVPKPQLALSGIAWGPEPAAVIEGIPGIEGSRLVRPREVVGPLTVRAIRRSSVTVSGFDTTWTLTVRIPWK